MACWRLALLLKLVSVTQQTQFCQLSECWVSEGGESDVSLLQRQASIRARQASTPQHIVSPWLRGGSLEQKILVLLHDQASTSQVAVSGPVILLMCGGVAVVVLLLGGGCFFRTRRSEMSDREKHERALIWSQRAYFFSAFIYSVSSSVMAVKLPYHLIDLGLKGFHLSIIQTASLLGGVTGALFLGWLSDTVGSRTWILVICSIMCSITYLLLQAITAIPLLMALQFCLGFFGGTFPVEAAFITDGVPGERRASVLAMQQCFIAAGAVAGSVLNSLGVADLKFDSVCYLMSGLALIRSASSYIFFVDGPQFVPRETSSESVAPELETDNQASMLDLANSVIISLVVLAGIREAGWAMIVGTEPLFLNTFAGMDAERYSIASTIAGLFSLVTSAFAPRIINSFGSLQSCTYSGLMSSLFTMPLIVHPSETTCYVKNCLAYGIFKTLVIIASLDVVGGRCPQERRAVVFGLCKTGEQVASMLADPIGGALYDNFSPCIGYVFCSAGMAVLATGYAFLPATKVRARAQCETTLSNITQFPSEMAIVSERYLCWYRCLAAIGSITCLCFLAISFCMRLKWSR